MIGKTIGNYEIAEKIGAGGMGEVFRARDTKLERDVAIKVLPTDFASQPDRLSRFQREAKLLAGLNHSNIGAIYGLEEADGAQYLVLELIEGEDLSQRLSRGPIPVDEAIEIARQIAVALEAAHEQGIIHRDLKPANIQLTPDGQVKVLDFGLAKALDSSGDSGADLSQSPTILGSSPTVAGVILGTAAYMSPEQARGKQVDKRADVFAFGIVLYEMLSGDQLFGGDTVSDTLAAVLRATPDYAKLPANTPPALRRLIERCQEKDVKRRLRDIGEARIVLEDIQSGAAGVTGPGGAEPAATKRGFLRVYGGWIAAGVVAIASIIGMLTVKPATREPDLPLRKSAMTMSSDDPSRATAFDPALSPNGRYLAYVSQNRLWLRDLRTLDSRAFEETDGTLQPFWSYDGEWIGFGIEGSLYKVPRTGGKPTLIATLPSGIALGMASSAIWTADDRIIIGPGTAGLHEVSAQGGNVSGFLDPGGGETDFHEVCRLPDGSIVFVVHDTVGIGRLDLITPQGQRKGILDISEFIADPAYSPSGHILFQRGGTPGGVWALPFSVDRLEATGDPFLVAPDGREVSTSLDGTIAFTRGAATLQCQLVWLSRDGTVLGTLGDPTSTGRPFPHVSPDGTSVVMAEDFNDTRELFLYDVASGNRRRLTFNEIREDVANWHPNGRDLLYYDSGTYTLHLLSLDGSSESRSMGRGIMPMVSPDGSKLVFSRERLDEWKWDIYVQPFDGGEARAIVATDAVDWWPSVSPNGHHLLYMSDETGANEVYATTFPNPTTRWQVSSDGGFFGMWRPDGKEIFYTTHDAIYAVDCDITSGLKLGTPKKLFDRPSIDWSTRWADGFGFTADGERFIVVQPIRQADDASPEIVIVQNWFAEFDKSAKR